MELSFDVYDPTQSDEQSNEKAQFLWFRLLIDALIKIKETFSHKDLVEEYRKQNSEKDQLAEEFIDKYVAKLPVKHFVDICKQHFAGNEQQLGKINQFELNYEPSKSLYWYTREPFVYRILNKALRYENIDNLYQYRFLIRDIFNELNERKFFDQSNFHLYRGQAMLNEEFQRLTKNSKQLLRINSFLSTSKDKQIALGFALSSVQNDDKKYRAVLFDIEIDTQINDTRPYADISNFSQYHDEEEILFMCGIVFQLKNILYDNQLNIWILELKLSSEQDYELKIVYEQLQEQYLSDKRNLNLIDLGNILKDIGNDEKAEKYYLELLNTLNENDPLIQRCLHNFGILAYRRSDFDTALEYLQQALDLEFVSNIYEQSFIRSIYTWIGNVYFTQNNLQYAFNNYNQALKFKSEIDCRDRIIETGLYANIANIYTLRGEYDLALEKHFECLNIKLSFLNAKDPKIAASKVNIAIIYRRMKKYQQAINSLLEALDIQRETLSSNHVEIAVTFYNMALIYEELHDYYQAYENYQEAVNIFSETHPYMSRTLEALYRVQSKMK